MKTAVNEQSITRMCKVLSSSNVLDGIMWPAIIEDYSEWVETKGRVKRGGIRVSGTDKGKMRTRKATTRTSQDAIDVFWSSTTSRVGQPSERRRNQEDLRIVDFRARLRA